MLTCNIGKKLGGFSLDVNISVEPGVTALLGASGSGKSMTLRCIAGISKPDRGRIELNGVALFDSEKKINLPPQKRNTGFLFQDYALFPNMTVRQNIMAGAKGKTAREKQAAAEELSEAFHIAPHLDKHPVQLSGGEKQRCALARILAGSPDILMLDEPFGALDSHLRWALEIELAETFKRFRKPVLYVSHNRSEIFRLCDNIVIINGGRNEACGDKWGIFKNPATVQAARVTGCKNIAAAQVAGTRVSVPDWGICFEPGDIPNDVDHIGIRANHIIPVSAAKKEDIAVAFPFEIANEIEDTFTYILMVRKQGTDLPVIRWEIPKKDRAALKEMPQELAFLREHILYLKQEGKQ
ncbi:MAG: ATP-binding cassette domain-containing protein [Chitinispirillales bacterium]|jgi:molybdate transport system ATP-binding protein|nr:ATP-binding cassette domain-containing protein [Chitinispirillales bacterium]